MGQSGNIPIKSKFDNIFDIREDYSLNIQNIRKIYFSIQRLWGKSLTISRNFYMGPLFSKYDWMGAHNSGLQPLFHFGLKYIFSKLLLIFLI